MTGYVRKDTTNNIADGNVINAADLDAEFDGVQDAFNASTGHNHDGTTGEGAPITALGPTQDVTISAILLAPKTNNTVDIGSSSLKFKDLFLAGNGSIGGTLAVTGVATLTAQPILSSLTASRAVFTDGSKGLVSNAITGTGNVVMSASPTLTGTIDAAAATLSGNLTLSGGTANGVAYLNGSKVVTSGSALTFDGTALGVSGTVNDALSVTSTATTTALKLNNTNANGWGSNVAILTGGTAAGYFGTIGSLLGSTAQDLTVYATASNGFRVYTNGNNERMRVTSGGDVGIGTSSITGGYKLQVNGNLLLSSTTPLVVGNSTLTLLGDNTSSTGLLLNTAGNLGLGVTPSAWNSVLKAVSVGRAGSNIYGQTSANLTGITANAIFDSSDWKYVTTDNASRYQQNGGVHSWYNAPSGTAGNAITFTQAMTLDASGNLLVGTTSPTYSASGRGLVEVNGSSTSLLALKTGGSAAGYLYHDGTALSLVNTKASYIQFTTNGIDAARIDSSGNFRVGTADASGTSGVGCALNPTSSGVRVVSAATTNAVETYSMYSTGAANYRFYVGWGGTVYATNTTITAISDQRLKENIRDLDEGLATVMALKPRKFDWKAGKGADIKNARGFIAQEFETVLPDMIETWKDPAPEGEDPYKAINANLIPTLVKAIQELKAEFDAYKASHP